jgi:ATP-dependent protease ClpP protease subunit
MEIKENLYGGIRGGGRVRRGDEDGYYSLTNPFEVSVHRSHAMKFNVYLFGTIKEAAQFIPAIEVLQAAGEDDEVHVHLSTPGGSMDATDTFLSAMHQCEGRVVVHASGGCHSCGSIILMHANEFTLSEDFNMLVHNGSLGGYDDLNKFAAHAKHGVEYMMKVMRRTYEGFLTPEELQAMIDGKDFWMDGKEFMERHGRRMEHFKAKLKMQKEAGSEPTPRRSRKNSQK